MDDNSEKNYEERVSQLEEENRGLRIQLKELKRQEEEFQTYRLYSEARKKLLGFISILLVILTVFGFVSIQNVLESIKRKLEERGIESIVKEIKQDFIGKHQSFVVSEIKTVLQPQIEAKIGEAIRENLLNVADEVQKTEITTSDRKFSKAIQKSFKERKYYVIGMTSTRRSDIEKEKERVRNLVGSSFKKQFPDVEIYAPEWWNKVYTLLISGKALPYDEAIKIKNKAIEAGFQRDTWIWQSTENYFSAK